ncbi:TetR/AcrR family transcriptional regulator [Actinomadura sp. 6K520]|uniref:TetR/AcrR family transcriptional regulator n=1 Tax=Actinomadura sp. 6K520 TaxID=2530364 RepID=UPI0010531D2B|nr:TetR/AcrR family transcriptional regulator [Actinomadura sp. 6K520]TDE30064.1 TetR/AcrR family transcriptional regulator [Actinomadura sp. 6K520]
MADDEVPTRIRLLEAAVAVLAEGGWSAVTSRAVADRAQANNALVHYYFGSVAALRRAAVMHAMERELEGPVEAILRAEDVLDGVAAAVRRLARSGAGSGEGTDGQRVLAEALTHGMRDEELRAQSELQVRAFRDMLSDRLAANQAAGLLRADADPAGLAVVLGALLDGLLVHMLIDPGTDMTGPAAGLLALLRPPGGAPGGPAPEGRADERRADERHADGGDGDEAS